jgi:hypothetical protein
MSLKDLARAVLAKSCPSVPVPSRGTVGHQGRTPAHTISGTAGTVVQRGTIEPAGTVGTLGTLGTTGTTGTRLPVLETIPASPEPDAAEIAERAALAAGVVPEAYLQAWARFQLQRPRWALEGEWLEAVDSAGRFLDHWGQAATALGWRADEIFGRHGLAFALRGAKVRALEARRAEFHKGRKYERTGV